MKKQSIKEILSDLFFGYDMYEGVNRDKDGKFEKTKEGIAIYYVVISVIVGLFIYTMLS